MPVVVGSERLVNTVTDGAQRPGDVAVGRSVATVWIDESSGTGVAKLRLFDQGGAPATAEIVVGSAVDVAVAPSGDGFVVVRIVQTGSLKVDIVAQAYGASGQPVGAAVTLETHDTSGALVPFISARGLDVTSLSDGGYAVGWTESTASLGGTTVVSGRYLVASAQGVVEGRGGLSGGSGRAVLSNDADISFTELPNGQILATYQAIPVSLQGPPLYGNYVQVIDASGQLVGLPVKLDQTLPTDGGPPIDGRGDLAAASLGGGKVAFAWESNGQAFVSVYDISRLAQGEVGPRTVPVSIGLPSEGELQVTALADGRFVVGYSTNGDVWARVFLPSGAAEGPAVQLNTVFQGEQDELRLFASRDGVIGAVWRDQGGVDDPSGAGVKVAVSSIGLSQTGGSGRDTLTGGASDDVLSGLAGDDVLIGAGGADTLLGGMGGDSLIGGAGNNRLDGGSNTDFISYSDVAIAVTVDLTAGVATGGGGADTLVSIEAVYGSQFNDVLTGNYLSNLIVGDAGNDTIEGQSGANYLDGGAGNDILVLVGQVTDYFVTGLSGANARLIGPYGVDEALNFERVRVGTTEMTWQDFTSQAFNGLRYIASNPDLIASLGADAERGRQHWLSTGRAEGRPLDTFDPLRYAASNPDIAAQLYIDTAALTRHFIQTGFAAGRSATSFDPLQYAAINPDLLRAFGVDAAAFTRHYAVAGVAENRPLTGFDPLLYGASHDDLARFFGNDSAGLFQHWINAGVFEGREPNGFDAVAYVLSYPELAAAGVSPQTAVNHWLTVGADQGLRGDELFGREQASHLILNGVVQGELRNFTTSGRSSEDRDWFEIGMQGSRSVRITVSGADSGRGTLADPRVEIYDASGRLVASDEDGGPGRDAVFDLFNGGPPATRTTYYIVVRSSAGDEGTYEVGLEFGFQGGPADGWIT
jgi:hypothetical protein